MKLHESGENYLETILLIKKEKGNVRSIDIANALSYSKASVSRAVKILQGAGLIEIDENGLIEFTLEGQKRAAGIYSRHNSIADFLINSLGIDEKTAENDACRIEHVLSNETFDAIKKFNKKFTKI
jgi:Mn-dependent DtxR family transcriptional regulator